jgi:phosphoglycerol transferase MdoB-like AlkP superfamily enzyme
MPIAEPVTSEAAEGQAPASELDRHLPNPRSPWIASARFLAVWMFPASLGLYMKWYMMADQGGFAREARSMGLNTLNILDRLSFFRADLILGALVIPAALFVVIRFLPVRWAAILTGIVSGAFIALIAIQVFALKEVGRFSSWKMVLVGLDWGWHEPGSSIQYLLAKETLIPLVSLAGTVVAMVWAVGTAGRTCSRRSRDIWKVSGELFVFAVAVAVIVSFKTEVLTGPYHESSFVRSVTSLWKENAVETGEFAGLNVQRADGLTGPDFTTLSAADLVARYGQFTHAPAAQPNSAYFGNEKGANVLFFILETAPQKYLPVDGDMSQFPNMARLRERSFVGTRHYTTFPITRAAVFSMFSSWYPIDDSQDIFDSPGWDRAGDFLRRLDSEGYKTAVFSPLQTPGVPDAAVFTAVGFDQQFYPASAITSYDQQPSWKAARLTADLDTLHLLEAHIDQWTSHGDRFAAAFLPQIGHSPYPDSDPVNTAEELEKRGRAIIATQDGWLGEIVALLEKRGQLDNTIIVILGDHGLRTITENPNLRRGTIDETAFHVPLLIYAPRALEHRDRITWLTSHIDIVPTVLDLLGVKGNRDSEQGSAVWNPALADRTTFFFAKPMFGADGYTQGGQFFMWHYFSDSVYQKSIPEFDPSDITPRKSAVAHAVTSNILTMGSLERAWHARFASAPEHPKDVPTPGSVTP